MEKRGGCLQGLFELFLLNTVFDFLQDNFGFGKGCSCTGIGCGCLMLIIFLILFCSIMTNTNWLKLY